MIAELITVKVKEGDITFLPGTRMLAVAGRHLNIKGFEVFAKVFNDAGFEEVAVLLWAAHENASFFKKTDLVYETPDHMYCFIDEVGLTEAMEVMASILTGAIGEGGKKKAGVKAKTPK